MSTTVDNTIGFNIAGTDTITLTYNGQTLTTSVLPAATADTIGFVAVAGNVQPAMNAALTTACIADQITIAPHDAAGTVAGEVVFSFRAAEALTFGTGVVGQDGWSRGRSPAA